MITITGVQLEKSPTATSFDWRPQGTELALCQRYYQTNNIYMDVYGQGGNAGLKSSIYYAVKMRATPTGALTTSSTFNIATPALGVIYDNMACLSFASSTAGTNEFIGSAAFTAEL